MYRSGGGRINERDVPESQHTIFIRGLPGSMGSDEIREFFQKDYGSCSFDFVKMSPDRSKLYVAVRFDSKQAARVVMEKFSSGDDMLGYKVEMTWFRDIRRYLAHCAKQGVQPSRLGRRDDYGSRRRDDDRSRGRRRSSIDRSPTRSPARSGGGGGIDRSRSASAADSHGRSRSRSQSRSRSRSQSASSAGAGGDNDTNEQRLRVASPEREKSLELDYNDTSLVKRERPSPSPSPPPPPKKSRRHEKRRKDKREKRRSRRSTSPRSGSDMDLGEDGEEIGELVKQHDASGKTFIGPMKPIPQQSPQKQQQQLIQPPQPTTFYQRYETMAKQQQPPLPPLPPHLAVPKVELRNQSIMLDLSAEHKGSTPAMPKFKPIGELTSSMDYQHQQFNGARENSMDRQPQQQQAPPPQAPAPIIRNVPAAAAPNPPPATAANNSAMFGSSTAHQAPPPVTIIHKMEPGLGGGGKPLNNFKEIQRSILQDVRYKPAEEAEEEDHCGQLRLSSLSRKTLTEDKREEKMAKLTPELRERIDKKKRQLELSYRNDCEAYGLVVNKLISKDRSLEDRIKLALLDTMKELEAETMKQLDEFVDQFSFLCA